MPGFGWTARPMVGQLVNEDVAAAAEEPRPLEAQRLEPRVPAAVGVHAEHRGMTRLPMPPPERDAATVPRLERVLAGFLEDRHEIRLVAELEQLTAGQWQAPPRFHVRIAR